MAHALRVFLLTFLVFSRLGTALASRPVAHPTRPAPQQLQLQSLQEHMVRC